MTVFVRMDSKCEGESDRNRSNPGVRDTLMSRRSSPTLTDTLCKAFVPLNTRSDNWLGDQEMLGCPYPGRTQNEIAASTTKPTVRRTSMPSSKCQKLIDPYSGIANLTSGLN